MEDYILREIDKIGKLIEALLQKAGILRRSGAGEAVCETARTELARRSIWISTLCWPGRTLSAC